jgi:hypothetical protein
LMEANGGFGSKADGSGGQISNFCTVPARPKLAISLWLDESGRLMRFGVWQPISKFSRGWLI